VVEDLAHGGFGEHAAPLELPYPPHKVPADEFATHWDGAKLTLPPNFASELRQRLCGRIQATGDHYVVLPAFGHEGVNDWTRYVSMCWKQSTTRTKEVSHSQIPDPRPRGRALPVSLCHDTFRTRLCATL